MPLLEYRHPQQDQIPPLFMAGRYRFPSPSHRLLPTVFLQPKHTPLHPGMFPSPQFEEEIWSSHPINIVNSYITSISPEHTYFGIDYVINICNSVATLLLGSSRPSGITLTSNFPHSEPTNSHATRIPTGPRSRSRSPTLCARF